MDSASRSAILNFIEDFKIKTPEGFVEFVAEVEYKDGQKSKTFATEVQIITSGNIEAVYLMNQEMSHAGLPDSFNSGKEKFVYLPMTHLDIIHDASGSDYVLRIIPTKRSLL